MILKVATWTFPLCRRNKLWINYVYRGEGIGLSENSLILIYNSVFITLQSVRYGNIQNRKSSILTVVIKIWSICKPLIYLKSILPYGNQPIDLKCKSIDWFRNNGSISQKKSFSLRISAVNVLWSHLLKKPHNGKPRFSAVELP